MSSGYKEALFVDLAGRGSNLEPRAAKGDDVFTRASMHRSRKEYNIHANISPPHNTSVFREMCVSLPRLNGLKKLGLTAFQLQFLYTPESPGFSICQLGYFLPFVILACERYLEPFADAARRPFNTLTDFKGM